MSLSALLVAPAGVACASGAVTHEQPGGPAAQAQAAPNGSEVSARVVNAVMVSSTTLGIEPEQPICVLTLAVASAKTLAGLLPAMPAGDLVRKEITVYSKTDLVKLKGGSITATIALRGSGSAARLWLVKVIESTPPR